MEADTGHVSALFAALDRSDKPGLRAAVDELISLALGSPLLRERLELRLAEAKPHGGWPTAYILGNLPNPPDAAIERLLDTLAHEDPEIRWAVALLLVRIAKEKPGVIRLLIRLCAAGSPSQKRMALYAIRDLGLRDSASLDAFFMALQDTDPTVRVAAAICLKPRLEVDETGKRRLLEVYLRDDEPKVRHAVAITLAALGNPQREFIRALQENRESEDKQTKKAALAALELLEKRRSASSGSVSGP